MTLQNHIVAAILTLVVIGKGTLSSPITTRSDPVICRDYARLRNITNTTWSQLFGLKTNFSSRRGVTRPITKPVDIRNLNQTANLTRARLCLTEREQLLKHHEYLSQYKVIIGYVLADEGNSSIEPKFTQEMRESRRLLSLTIVELEDVMIKTGSSPTEIEALTLAHAPSFAPKMQVNVGDRHKRDVYTLDDMTEHMRKAFEDFQYLQRKFYHCSTSSDLEIEDCDE